MPTDAVTATNTDLGGASTKSATSSVDAFRNADFLKIILAEITSQDPMNPMDTSKMVESLQQVQNLANSTYQKFRDDLTWAQNLVGNTVTVTQVGISDTEKQSLVNSGMNPDVGYGNVTGTVGSFRSLNNQVWLSVGGKDYPIANIQQVGSTKVYDAQGLTDASSRLLGMRVKYWTTDPQTTAEGVVGSVGFDSTGHIQLGVGTDYVPYNNLLAVTVPDSGTTATPAF